MLKECSFDRASAILSQMLKLEAKKPSIAVTLSSAE